MQFSESGKVALVGRKQKPDCGSDKVVAHYSRGRAPPADAFEVAGPVCLFHFEQYQSMKVVLYHSDILQNLESEVEVCGPLATLSARKTT